MALQLGAALDGCCGEGWQSNWFGTLNEMFVNWLCLYQSSRLGGHSILLPKIGINSLDYFDLYNPLPYQLWWCLQQQAPFSDIQWWAMPVGGPLLQRYGTP